MRKSKIWIVMTLIIVIMVNAMPPIQASGFSGTEVRNATATSLSHLKVKFNQLPQEARKNLEWYIANKDRSLISIHQQVTGNFTPIPPAQSVSTKASAIVNMDLLNSRLLKIGFSKMGRYGLLTCAAAMTFPFMDGILPVGDIVALIAQTAGIIMLSQDLKLLSAKTDEIGQAFQEAIPKYSVALGTVFYRVGILADRIYFTYNEVGNDEIEIVTPDKTIRFKKSKIDEYYFAIRNFSGGITRVCKIDRPTAIAIVRLGDPELENPYDEGVHSKTEAIASTLAKSASRTSVTV